LLGTIKSLDELDVITLNCTQNANTQVHDESLHCAWGLISRDGWAIVNDTENWGNVISGYLVAKINLAI